MDTFVLIGDIAGWMATIITVLLGFPQLVKLLKEKKTGKVSFTSFWVFNFGMLAWILFGSFLPGSLKQVSIANLLSVYLYSIMMFYLYYYLDFSTRNWNRKLAMILVPIVLVIFCIICTAITVYGMMPGAVKLTNKIATTILGAIVPSFTCLAFMPQIFLSFKTKNFGGVSAYMILLFLLNNFFWIIFWVSRIVQVEGSQASMLPIIIALCWQVFSTIIFSIQLGYTIDYHKKQKAKKLLEQTLQNNSDK